MIRRRPATIADEDARRIGVDHWRRSFRRLSDNGGDSIADNEAENVRLVGVSLPMFAGGPGLLAGRLSLGLPLQATLFAVTALGFWLYATVCDESRTL